MKHHDNKDDQPNSEASESEVQNEKPLTECQEKDIELKNWEEEYNQLYDKYLRLYSDFDNFRKRTNKEKLDLIDSANESLIFDLLAVLDDFERAESSMKDTADMKSVITGVNLVHNKFRKVLTDKGLKEIKCIEEPFDPELHDAIARIPAQKKKLKGRVIDQVQTGYYLKNRVIRHSKVVVGE